MDWEGPGGGTKRIKFAIDKNMLDASGDGYFYFDDPFQSLQRFVSLWNKKSQN